MCGRRLVRQQLGNKTSQVSYWSPSSRSSTGPLPTGQLSTDWLKWVSLGLSSQPELVHWIQFNVSFTCPCSTSAAHQKKSLRKDWEYCTWRHCVSNVQRAQIVLQLNGCKSPSHTIPPRAFAHLKCSIPAALTGKLLKLESLAGWILHKPKNPKRNCWQS